MSWCQWWFMKGCFPAPATVPRLAHSHRPPPAWGSSGLNSFLLPTILSSYASALLQWWFTKGWPSPSAAEPSLPPFLRPPPAWGSSHHLPKPLRTSRFHLRAPSWQWCFLLIACFIPHASADTSFMSTISSIPCLVSFICWVTLAPLWLLLLALRRRPTFSVCFGQVSPRVQSCLRHTHFLGFCGLGQWLGQWWLTTCLSIVQRHWHSGLVLLLYGFIGVIVATIIHGLVGFLFRFTRPSPRLPSVSWSFASIHNSVTNVPAVRLRPPPTYLPTLDLVDATKRVSRPIFDQLLPSTHWPPSRRTLHVLCNRASYNDCPFLSR